MGTLYALVMLFTVLYIGMLWYCDGFASAAFKPYYFVMIVLTFLLYMLVLLVLVARRMRCRGVPRAQVGEWVRGWVSEWVRAWVRVRVMIMVRV